MNGTDHRVESRSNRRLIHFPRDFRLHPATVYQWTIDRAESLDLHVRQYCQKVLKASATLLYLAASVNLTVNEGDRMFTVCG